MNCEKCKVLKEHRSSFPNPLIVKKGEILTVGDQKTEEVGWIWCINKEGNGCWAPQDYISITGNRAEFLQDYNSIELNVNVGQILSIQTEAQGWIWVIDERQNTGWIPKRNVEIINI